MNAVDGTDVDTGGVLRADARFADDVRHADALETESWVEAKEYNSGSCGHPYRGNRAGMHESALRRPGAGHRAELEGGARIRGIVRATGATRGVPRLRIAGGLGSDARRPARRPRCPAAPGRLDPAGDDSLRRVRIGRQL